MNSLHWAPSCAPSPKTKFCRAQGVWHQTLWLKGNVRITGVETSAQCRSAYQQPPSIFYLQTPSAGFVSRTARRRTAKSRSCQRVCAECLPQSLCFQPHPTSSLLFQPEHFNTTLQVANWNVQSSIAGRLDLKRKQQYEWSKASIAHAEALADDSNDVGWMILSIC